MRNGFVTVLSVVLFVALGGCGDQDTGEEQTRSTQGTAATTPAEPAAAPSTTTEVSVAVPKEPETPAAAVPPPPVAVQAQTEEQAANTADAAPAAAPAGPTQHEVRGVVTQWRPMVLFVQPGDTVVFRQMTGHDTETMEGLYPEGAPPWQSKLGEEGYSVKLEQTGAYLYKCNPHVSSGMIGAIVVGDVPPANLAALEASPQNKGMTGRAIRKLKEALAAAAP